MDKINKTDKMFNTLIIIFVIILIISALWPCSVISKSAYLAQKYHKISPIITFGFMDDCNNYKS
jgi:hypothetical protein